MKLTSHFTLEEMTVTTTGLPNVPTAYQVENLKLLCENVLEKAREMYGGPITVTSGFRSQAVNSHKDVKGATNSQHTSGEAADIKCADNAKLFRLIRTKLKFDQLIWEKGNDLQPQWIHVSFKRFGNRGQVFRILPNGTKSSI